MGQVIQLQGDQRNKIFTMLVEDVGIGLFSFFFVFVLFEDTNGIGEGNREEYY